MLTKMRRALGRMSAGDRSLLMHMARKVSHESRGGRRPEPRKTDLTATS